MIAQDVLLYYPDPNKPFDIVTDASDYQLGGIISQLGHPVAFYSRKLTDAQRKYPTPDKEKLCIQEILEEFRDILYGAVINIKTDHKNLVSDSLKSNRLHHPP